MDRSSRNAALAALCIMLVFGVGAFYLPVLVLAVGQYSPYAGGGVAVLFVASFFLVFWLRARRQRKGGN